MLNYNNKYKDRNPEETIQIIKNFFNSQKLTILFDETQSEIGTWFCHLELYNDNYYIVQANGKGINRLYAQASGYAELYERYCNQGNELKFTLNYKLQKEKNFNQYNYYLAPDEKIISYKEATTSSKRIKYKFKLLDTKEHNLQSWLDIVYNNTYVALPFINLNNLIDKKYFVPEFVDMTAHSDGMAAGNTLEEALVQGISEIYEHMIWDKVYKNTKKKTPVLNIFELNISNELKQKGINLLKLGYKFQVFDYSYLYNIPVVGLLLINCNELNYSLILGAHPCFEIALERCFTELYQGITSYKYKQEPIFLFKDIDYKFYQYKNFHSLSCRTCYNEKQFYNIKLYNDFNKKIFISTNNELTNQELLNYYKDLALKNNDHFYYRDFSLCKDMKAVHVFLDNKIYFNTSNFRFERATNKQKKETIFFLKQLNKSMNKFLITENLNAFNKLIQNKFLKEEDRILHLASDYLFYSWDILSLYTKDDNLIFLLQNFSKNNKIQLYYDLEKYFKNSKINHYLGDIFKNIYLTQLKKTIFLNTNNYSQKELDKIFNKIFNVELINNQLGFKVFLILIYNIYKKMRE